jgi:hypothetical protein
VEEPRQPSDLTINKADFSADEKVLIFAGVDKREFWVDIASTLTGSKSAYRRPEHAKNFYYSSV